MGVKSMENIKNTKEQLIFDCLYALDKKYKTYECYAAQTKPLSPYKAQNAKWYQKDAEIREKFFEYKKILLSVVEPICIHKTPISFVKKRFFEDEELFLEAKSETLGRIYNYGTTKDKEGNYIDYVDVLLKDQYNYTYNLFYNYNNECSYHTQIAAEEVEKWTEQGLPVIKLESSCDMLNSIADLLSNSIIDDIVEQIRNKDF